MFYALIYVNNQIILCINCMLSKVIFVFGNLTFHECKRHIEIDYHFIHEKMVEGVIKTPYVPCSSHFMASSPKFSIEDHDSLGMELGMFDLYLLAQGGVLIPYGTYLFLT